jgi:hypothetical protein
MWQVLKLFAVLVKKNTTKILVERRSSGSMWQVLKFLALLVQKYLLYSHKNTTKILVERRIGGMWQRYSVYLLCWYKSTNADAAASAAGALGVQIRHLSGDA